MSARAKDPLLTACRYVIVALKVVVGLIAAGLVVAIPAFLFSASHVREAMLPEAAGNLAGAMSAIVVALLLGIAILGLAYHFLELLGRIVATVGEGDPFVPANAARLARMAWIVLINQGLGMAMAAVGVFLRTQFPPETVKLDAPVSLGALVLALVLFVLARVFREGTSIREELEGTV